jgi:glycosyltransferase involved in cell wall biosynthesis
VSVVIAAFADDRWRWLQEAVESVRAQTMRADEIVLVIDNNERLFARARAYFRDVLVIPNASAQGASGARNTGVAASRGDIVVFLDDDAVAHPTWLRQLVRHFVDPTVCGVGGRLVPLWEGTGVRPRWWPKEFDWAIGASYAGMPEQVAVVRNVWSGSMAVRRTDFATVDGFRVGFGKTGNQSRPEDTDLCLRIADARAGAHWIYDPTSEAAHRVPERRQTTNFFVRRCYHEGRGKAELARLNGAGTSTSSERGYAMSVLPAGVLRGVKHALRGDFAALLQSSFIVAGLASAAIGMTVGMLRQVTGTSDERIPADRTGAVADTASVFAVPTSTESSHAA